MPSTPPEGDAVPRDGALPPGLRKTAADRPGQAQPVPTRDVPLKPWARIGAAASRYLAEHTDGTVPCRFDLALVDRSGRTERLENVAAFDGW